EERAKKVREGADQYAVAILGDLQNRLSVALASVRKGQDALSPRQVAAPVSSSITEAAAQSKRAAFDAQDPEEIDKTHVMVETAELEVM
ncbi:MAG: hypothetical protein ACREML_04715, partial [Vulcanimicrobiaceae bacterium]